MKYFVALLVLMTSMAVSAGERASLFANAVARISKFVKVANDDFMRLWKQTRPTHRFNLNDEKMGILSFGNNQVADVQLLENFADGSVHRALVHLADGEGAPLVSNMWVVAEDRIARISREFLTPDGIVRRTEAVSYIEAIRKYFRQQKRLTIAVFDKQKMVVEKTLTVREEGLMINLKYADGKHLFTKIDRAHFEGKILDFDIQADNTVLVRTLHGENIFEQSFKLTERAGVPRKELNMSVEAVPKKQLEALDIIKLRLEAAVEKIEPRVLVSPNHGGFGVRASVVR